MKKEKINIFLNYYLIKLILNKGKLSTAESLISKFHLNLVKKSNKSSLIILEQSIKNIMPIFLLNKKKLGKRVIIRPLFILSPSTRYFLGLKWVVDSALKRSGKFLDNLIIEIFDAFNNKGSLKKKQQDLNSIVLDNRSNLKYRW